MTLVTAGISVFDWAISVRPDLLVLDTAFPDADGRDILAKLKSDRRSKDIPVLVWSSPKDRESESKIALSLGAEDYMEKNDPSLLMRKVERILLRLASPSARADIEPMSKH